MPTPEATISTKPRRRRQRVDVLETELAHRRIEPNQHEVGERLRAVLLRDDDGPRSAFAAGDVVDVSRSTDAQETRLLARSVETKEHLRPEVEKIIGRRRTAILFYSLTTFECLDNIAAKLFKTGIDRIRFKANWRQDLADLAEDLLPSMRRL